jgi:hypothetical protein
MDVDRWKKAQVEGLSPPLRCLIEMQSCIQNGETVRTGLKRFLQSSDPKDAFTRDVRAFLFAWEQGHDWRACVTRTTSPHRKALLEVAACGLAGQSVLPHLESLRTEIAAACDLEIQAHLEMLPLKMLVPLLLFQFPAFLLLLFGPLLRHLIEELNK